MDALPRIERSAKSGAAIMDRRYEAALRLRDRFGHMSIPTSQTTGTHSKRGVSQIAKKPSWIGSAHGSRRAGREECCAFDFA
ncbi:MAG: hypothetical protein AB7T19_13310 [Planctomycetota bacterium]